jgi:hypothetical protein
MLKAPEVTCINHETIQILSSIFMSSDVDVLPYTFEPGLADFLTQIPYSLALISTPSAVIF